MLLPSDHVGFTADVIIFGRKGLILLKAAFASISNIIGLLYPLFQCQPLTVKVTLCNSSTLK